MNEAYRENDDTPPADDPSRVSRLPEYECMYESDGLPYNEKEYAKMYDIVFGGNAEGAAKHHALLQQHCKPGYAYHGRWPKAALAGSGYDNPIWFNIVDAAYDLGGRPMADYVTIFRKKVRVAADPKRSA